MTEAAVRYQLEGDIASIHFDDGKANVLTAASLAALCEAFDKAEQQSRCVAWTGRPGRFCAGFDLDVVSAGGPAALALLLPLACTASRCRWSSAAVVTHWAWGLSTSWLQTCGWPLRVPSRSVCPK